MRSVELLNERKYSAILDDLNRFQEVHLSYHTECLGLHACPAVSVASLSLECFGASKDDAHAARSHAQARIQCPEWLASQAGSSRVAHLLSGGPCPQPADLKTAEEARLPQGVLHMLQRALSGCD